MRTKGSCENSNLNLTSHLLVLHHSGIDFPVTLPHLNEARGNEKFTPPITQEKPNACK